MSQEIDDPRRNFLVDALGWGLFASTGSILQPVLAMGDIPDQLPAGRSIYKLSGSVLVDGKQATLDTQIGSNSKVVTGASSQAIFVIEKDAFVLRSNSEIEFGGSGLLVDGLRMISGKLLSVFSQRKRVHTIDTATATIGIRGTGVYVEAEPDKSYICTCYGHTQIGAKSNPDITEDIVSEHHDKPVYVLSGSNDKKLIVPGPFINHTDAELALIESLVGRTTPFAYSGGGYEVPRARTY